jgi:hypothetical protein
MYVFLSQVAPLPFMAEDFPVGECTLYGCGDNACEQVHTRHLSLFDSVVVFN